MKQVGLVTTARADLGIYLPVMAAIEGSPALELSVIAGGSHLDEHLGGTAWEIEREGYRVAHSVPFIGCDTAATMSRATAATAEVLRSWRPDVLLVLGDRFEMLACALAGSALHVPLAHIHGGDVTEGAFDDAFRHALTKLSHLHFPATEESRGRIRQMGEEEWRITLAGSPAVDRVMAVDPEEMDLPARFLLVTYHPVTLEAGQERDQATQLVAALRATSMPCIVTAPNPDPGRDEIDGLLREFCATDPRSRFVTSAGARSYSQLMRRAAAMVGNSSSGLVEAGSVGLPVVNVGTRQNGRTRGVNVVDCGYPQKEISAALARALDPEFRESLKGRPSPYGDGHASERIVARLTSLEPKEQLLRKRFVGR